jgi:hypothetical protein
VSTSAIESLHKQLKDEKKAHARTRTELQAEIARTWRLVPSHYINLMGVYPPLRRLLHVLAEAADLQDPSRGAPIEDTMRTQFVHVGENASTSQTEAGVLSHRRSRAAVEEIRKQLDYFTHRVSKLIPGAEYEYNPPAGECECGCGRLVFQSEQGRARRFYSAACRKRAERKVKV